MKKLTFKLSLIAALVLSLNACSSSGSNSQNQTSTPMFVAPGLGTTNYEPLEISNVSNTGTFVGQRVVAFRNDLNQLQNSIRKNNEELQKIRTGVNANALEYHRAVAAIKMKLQVGTTPGNPNVLAMLQKAQENVQVMGSSGNALNQLSSRVSTDVTVSASLLDAIRASFAISGAVDEDHVQLKILENETSQTYVLLQSLQNEVANDAFLQQQYVETANATLTALDAPIRQGNHSGVAQTPVFQPRPRTNLAALATASSAPINQSTYTAAPVRPVQLMPLSAPSQDVGLSSTAAPTGKPFFAVKFNRSDVDYQAGLKNAINAARSRKPDVRFEVVAVNPNSGSYTDAQKNAGKIFQEIIANGVSPENVSLSSRVSAEVEVPEVQIFVR